MNLRIVQPPSAEPVSLAEVRLHCKIDAELSSPLPAHPEDDLLRTLITAAREHVERFTARALTDATYEYRCSGPAVGCIALPLGPIDAVASVVYLDEDEAEQTLDEAVWYFDDDPWSPRIALRKDQVWPAIYGRRDAVRVTFTGGVASPNPVPPALLVAIKLLVGHWYANRESASPTALTEIPNGVQALMQPHRRMMGV